MSEVPVTPPAPLDTGKVPDRRALPFESVGQGLADAERAGRLRRLGNWTLGQALGHLAAWAGYGYTGFPLRVPFFVHWFLRLRKRKYLGGPMRAGVKIPGVEGGTLATEPVPLGEALGRFRAVMQRLKTEAPTVP